MALTADQTATLRLLLERGHSYADLAGLLEIDESEVRDRARAALRDLGGADPDRNVALTDYLLGQADPIGRADVVRHLREDPEDYRLATTLAERLRETVPGAELPRLPGEPREGRILGRLRRPRTEAPPAAADRPERTVRIGSRLAVNRTRLLVALASGAILLVAIVLGVTGAFGGGDEESPATTTAASGDSNAGSNADSELTTVPLKPPGGGDARGQAIFGVASADQPYVDLSISGLDPAPSGQTYVAWLMLTRDQGYPLSPIEVQSNGTYQDRFALPSAILPVVARVRFVDISIAPAQEIADQIQKAVQNTQLVVDKPGRTVLLGDIPIAKNAS